MKTNEIAIVINAAASLLELLLRWQATRPQEFATYAEEVAALRAEATRLKGLPADHLQNYKLP